jgi:catechol 2,3-dioxygenase-like lactoylglutathione lyase family enzyme
VALHRLTSITIGVPDVESVAAYYEDFGLERTATGEATGEPTFATTDGGEQLRLVHTPRRRLVQLAIGADDPDDLDRIAGNLAGLGVTSKRDGDALLATDPGTEVEVKVEIAGRLVQTPFVLPSYNVPGSIGRRTARADGVLRENKVRPRRLGHAVVGSTDLDASMDFFLDGIGFKVSDSIPSIGAFMRCSTDHHNVLLQAAPVTMLHHTSWQVDDVDEVGRGATAMLEKDPGRHVWGLGRHHVCSNFFWYLKDPAGNFSEYFSDMDCILDDQLWTPQEWGGMHSLYNWGPPPPPSFINPDDLAELMTGSHSGA